MSEKLSILESLKELQRKREARDLVSPNVIPTMYKGIQFRSRLEARWAVFFDTLGIEWEYEPQGYVVGMHWEIRPGEMLYTFSDGTSGNDWSRVVKESQGISVVSETPATGEEDMEWYLPDFWLPELGYWVEVKGVFDKSTLITTVRSVDGFSQRLPRIDTFDAKTGSGGGLLYLGDIPNLKRNKRTGSHIIFTAHKGVENRAARFRFNSALQRVELEVGGEYDPWLYLDATCISEENVAQYGYPGFYEDVVKGLHRDGVKAARSLHDEKYDIWRSPWDGSKYAPIEDDTFGEAVIEAGWLAARNAQF